MSSPYVGEIRIFAGSFPPSGWAFCDGQLVAISENDILFTLLGTTYGGDGQQTFALPDLRSRLPIHQGTGNGLSNYLVGENGGVESVTLTTNQIPAHTHPFLGSTDGGTQGSPVGSVLAASNTVSMFAGAVPANQMAAQAALPDGGSQPHDNMQPYLGLNFIISLFGIFPSQN